MEIEVTPTEKIEKLKENLEKKVEDIREDSGKLVVETDDPEILGRTPGVEIYKVNGEEREGLNGSPVDEQAYARIESKEDAARAFLATVMGYDLRILNTEREWDYRNLKRYNPDIKHLKFDEPKDFLEIGKALFDAEGLEKTEIDLDEEDVEPVYRKMVG